MHSSSRYQAAQGLSKLGAAAVALAAAGAIVVSTGAASSGSSENVAIPAERNANTSGPDVRAIVK